MRIFDLLMLALGLSADAAAVSVCNGLTMNLTKKQKLVFSGSFGIAQAIMPLIGLLLGGLLVNIISSVDHWIALLILGFLGIKMLAECKKGEDCRAGFSAKTVMAQTVATSIDAFAAGISLTTLQLDPLLCAGVIGAVTFLCCSLASALAQRAGEKLGVFSKIAGGVILIGIGVKIFIEHML